jgi:hypothetical protein
MNIATFLGHYQLTENPFRAEEARHDSVFARVETACHHPDYEKIRGDFARPATAIVFGERGSGKTAIRLQIEDELAAHNAAHPAERCLPIIYDELNPVLDRFSRAVGKGNAADAVKDIRLVDHIDAMMSAIVPRLVDQALGDARGDSGLQLGEHARRGFRELDSTGRQDFITLQMCYDRPAAAASRTSRLKRAIRFHSFSGLGLLKWLAGFMFLLCAAATAYVLLWKPQEQLWLWYGAIGVTALLTLMALGRWGWMWMKTNGIARDLSRRLRVVDRPTESFRESLRSASLNDLQRMGLPRSDDDDFRYAMFGRLLNVIRSFGYRTVLVLVDRVDEPTLINGEPERMRALVWPLLNNKFLQQDRVGVKLLLPLDLRYLLNRETSDFFREARLDKQNLIERLTWSGAVLYDLCTARLNACRSPQGDGGKVALRDLFDDSVTTQDLVDALDQMQQPRDAFKFVYALIQEHCANVPDERAEFKIPRPVLDTIRKQQVERMSGMLRGVRPA